MSREQLIQKISDIQSKLQSLDKNDPDYETKSSQYIEELHQLFYENDRCSNDEKLRNFELMREIQKPSSPVRIQIHSKTNTEIIF